MYHIHGIYLLLRPKHFIDLSVKPKLTTKILEKIAGGIVYDFN